MLYKKILVINLLGFFVFFNTVKAANNATTGTFSYSIYGDNNQLIYSPYSHISGYDNYVYDAHGSFSDSSDGSKVIGTENTIGSGKNNAVMGSSNIIKGAMNSNGSHITGNNNTVTNSTNSNVIGNNNNVQGVNYVSIGNRNTVFDNSIAIGTNNNVSNGGIVIGSGLSASNADEVNLGDRQLTGVKAGVANTDAVNVNQLNQKASDTLISANNYTNSSFNSAKNTANNYTDSKIFDFLNDTSLNFGKEYANNRFEQLNKKLKKVKKEVEAGISSVIASASIPHRLGKKISFGLGVGSYKNEYAGAFGVKWGVSRSVAVGSAISFNTQSDTSVSLSLAYGF